MAKLSNERKIQQRRAAEDVRRIRARYAEALALGYTKEQAAELANDADPINPPGGVASIPVSQPVQTVSLKGGGDDTTKVETVNLTGGGEMRAPPESAPTVDIPPNWQDLPWPQLKALAERLNGGRDVKSRKQVNEIITAALGG